MGKAVAVLGQVRYFSIFTPYFLWLSGAFQPHRRQNTSNPGAAHENCQNIVEMARNGQKWL